MKRALCIYVTCYIEEYARILTMSGLKGASIFLISSDFQLKFEKNACRLMFPLLPSL